MSKLGLGIKNEFWSIYLFLLTLTIFYCCGTRKLTIKWNGISTLSLPSLTSGRQTTFIED